LETRKVVHRTTICEKRDRSLRLAMSCTTFGASSTWRASRTKARSPFEKRSDEYCATTPPSALHCSFLFLTLSINNNRYKPSSKIMLIDFRDSYFTSNPFDDSRSENRLNGNGIHLFAEHNPSVTIGTSSFNKRWINDCYGAQYVGKRAKRASCSNTRRGNHTAFSNWCHALR